MKSYSGLFRIMAHMIIPTSKLLIIHRDSPLNNNGLHPNRRIAVYLGKGSVLVTSFTEKVSSTITSDLSHMGFLPWARRSATELQSLPKKNAGCRGGWSLILLLVSITITEDILGLSSGCSWTQRRPMWMLLITLLLLCPSSDWFISVDTVPLVQQFHTCYTCFLNSCHIFWFQVSSHKQFIFQSR